MSVDYDAAGGIGLVVTDEIVKKLMAHGAFTAEDWDDDKDRCIDRLKLNYAMTGNCYTGHTGHVLLVPGSTLAQINENAPAFVATLQSWGVNIEVGDLEVVSEIYIS